MEEQALPSEGQGDPVPRPEPHKLSALASGVRRAAWPALKRLARLAAVLGGLSWLLVAVGYTYLIAVFLPIGETVALPDDPLTPRLYGPPAIVFLSVSVLVAFHTSRRLSPGRMRAALAAWALSLAFAGVFMVARWVVWTYGVGEDQEGLFLQFVLLGVVLVWYRVHIRRTRPRAIPTVRGISTALAYSALIACPWLVLGSLGSALDTLLAFLIGASFGILAAWLLDQFVVCPLAALPHQRRRDRPSASAVAATALLLMSAHFYLGTLSAILVFVLPPVACLAVRIGQRASEQEPEESRWPAMATLIGVVVAAIAAFTDPGAYREQISHDFQQPGVLHATIASAGMALLAVACLPLLRRLFGRRMPLRFGLTAALLLWVAVLAASALAGTPGFYGDHMLVVLDYQTPVCCLPRATFDQLNPVDRRARVYEHLVDQANDYQARLRQELTSAGFSFRPMYILNALAVETADLPVRWWLRQFPEVRSLVVEDNLRVVSSVAELLGRVRPEAPDTRYEGLPRRAQYLIGADHVWNLGASGQGVVVGNIDTGVDLNHPEVRGSYRGRATNGELSHDYNWYDPGGGSPTPVDHDGHGTATMAVIVGESVGVAPEARWVSCSSASSNIAVLECLQFMLAPFPQGADPLANGMPALGADVVNISLQMPRWEGDVLDYALGAMRSAGVFIATAVGNDGPWYGDGGDALGGSPSVFSVGAITPTDMVADFSSGGQARIGPETSGGPAVKPDLVAPGVAVLTAYPPDSIVPLDGTSLASPCVAGTVALLWSANPSLTGNVPETSDILRASARQPQTAAVYTSSDVSAYRVDASELAHYPNSYYGWGILDAYAAVELALSR